MPPSNTFSRLFSHSPIKPLQQHMLKVVDCSNQLEAYMQAAFKGDWQEAENIYNKIVEIENQADEDKKNIRLSLPKSLFMPINRNDLLELLSKQDRVANCAKDIAGTMLGRKMSVPEQLQELMATYVKAALETVAEANTIVHELDELIETGFGGREIQWIEDLINKLDELESVSDKHQIEIRSALHAMEKELPPVDVMFLYKIFELIGSLADRAQKVGDQIHVIVAR